MQIYINLVVLSLIGVAISAYLSFQVVDRNVTFISTVLAYVISLLLTFVITKKETEDRYENAIKYLKKEFKIKVKKLKRDHDAINLERTIRDGTRTLIKNAVDYFKIENIKNEMPASAAIQNLQLDKYGQIIELLADFSLILPDYKENQAIVEQEINHQIDIFEVDEKDFALFLRRIMEKYVITVKKKIKEKTENDFARKERICPLCAESVKLDATVCKHCGHDLADSVEQIAFESIEDNEAQPNWISKGSKSFQDGNFEEAIKIFTMAINMKSKPDQAFYNRGVVYRKMNNFVKAQNDFKSAASMGHKKALAVLEKMSNSATQEWS